MAEQLKPSGIDWIGDIPESWKVKPLKYLAKCNQDVLLETTAPDYSFRYVDIGSVTYERGITEYQELRFEDSPSRARRRVSVGDTIISTVRTYLKAIAIISDSENVIVSTGFAVYTPDKAIYPRYLYYFCKSEGFVQEIDKNSYGIAYPAINTDLLNRICIAYPCYEEQQGIADFLDKECAQIDSIAADLEKQITLLQQYKKSLITEMTTPDDSCNWIKTKIKYIGEIRGRIGFRGYTVEDTVDPETPGCAVVLGGTNIMKDGTTDYENLTFLSENKYFESPEIMLYGGEILITKVGAGTGENSVYDGRFERATTNPNVMILIPKKFVNSQYVNYMLLSKPIKEDMKVESTKSGAQPAINQGYVNNIVIYIPTLERQDFIVEYLDMKCADIDDTIRIKNDQLKLIRQHKKSLIYEYVTGKKRVKEVQ